MIFNNPAVYHSQVLVGAELAGIPPCLPHSQVRMGAGLAGRPPCLPHSQVLMGAGLAGRPPCLPHNQVLMGAELAGGHSLSTTQSSPYGCWVSWGTLPVYHTVRSLWVLG